LVAYLYAGPLKKGADKGKTALQIDDALVDIPDVRHVMYSKLVEQPRLIVSMRVDDETEMGIVTDVQEELRQASTFRINYSTKRQVVAS